MVTELEGFSPQYSSFSRKERGREGRGMVGNTRRQMSKEAEVRQNPEEAEKVLVGGEHVERYIRGREHKA